MKLIGWTLNLLLKDLNQQLNGLSKMIDGFLYNLFVNNFFKTKLKS